MEGEGEEEELAGLGRRFIDGCVEIDKLAFFVC